MGAKELLARCQKECETLVFDRFTREDAFELGCLIYQNSKKYPDPCCVEITVNGLVVFRYFPEGTIPDGNKWLARKRNTVDLMHMSSLQFLAWLEAAGETVEGRKLDPNEYAAGGGGFPLTIRSVGVVGSICVSGMPRHEDDHQLVVDSITEFLARQKQA